MFTNRLNQTVYLLFEEPGLLASFLDYLNNLDVNCLYTSEQSRRLISSQCSRSDS